MQTEQVGGPFSPNGFTSLIDGIGELSGHYRCSSPAVCNDSNVDSFDIALFMNQARRHAQNLIQILQTSQIPLLLPIRQWRRRRLWMLLIAQRRVVRTVYRQVRIFPVAEPTPIFHWFVSIVVF